MLLPGLNGIPRPPQSPPQITILPLGCKDGKGRYEVDEIIKSPRGLEALTQALKFDCKSFIAQPAVQNFIHREWLGPLLSQATDADNDAVFRLRCWALAIMAWLLCMLFLPIVAVAPFLETTIFECIASTHQEDLERSKPERKSRTSDQDSYFVDPTEAHPQRFTSRAF